MADMNKEIRVKIITHEVTGLMIAMSDDLPGLYVHGRTSKDLERAIPIAIRDILEAQTGRKIRVTRDDDVDANSPFVPAAIRYQSKAEAEAA